MKINPILLPQFGDAYDPHKVKTLVEELERLYSSLRSLNVPLLDEGNVFTGNMEIGGTLQWGGGTAIPSSDDVQRIFDTTPAETAAGVTPVNKQYPPGYVLRFIETFVSGTTDMTAAIQSALDSAPIVVFPDGVLMVSDTVRAPSNRMLFGSGKPLVTPNTYPTAPTFSGGTLIRMLSSVGRATNVLQIGTRDTPSNNVTLSDLGVDFNRARWSESGGDNDGEEMHSTAIGIYGSENVRLNRVAAADGYKHSVDVTAPDYGRGQSAATVYDDQPARYVWLNEVYACGAGDDNITTHQCEYVYINDCVSEHPTGEAVPGNSNPFEIDDGSRSVFITNCVGIGGDNGLQIKGHNDAPAPYDIVVNGFQAINNRLGVEVRHTGWYSATDTDLADETVDEDGNPFEFTGASPNARNLILNNITIVAPTNVTPNGTAGLGFGGFRLRSYENVIINNLIITDGVLGADGDFEPFDDISNNLIRIYSGARHVQMRNTAIYGFPDITPSGTAAFWVTSSFAGPMLVDGLTAIDGPSEIFRASGAAGPIQLDNYFILGDHPTVTPIILVGSNKRTEGGIISGYLRQSPAATGPLQELRKAAVTTGGSAGTPAPFLSMVWEEGVQDLGAGEGISLNFACNLVDNGAGVDFDGVDYPFGNIQFRKTIGDDSSAAHDFAIQLIEATDESAPRDVFSIQSTGAVSHGLASATATEIADIGDVINTANKFTGKQVIDTTNDRLLYASGVDAGDPWHVVDGSATVTPS
jgi:hypothetical protein